MTPCEELGYAVGDRFEVITSDCACFTKGSVLELEEDDGSNCPLFKLIQGTAYGDNYVLLGKIKKLPKETSMDALIKARETYGQAKESLEQALQKVREDYPWLQIGIREDVQEEKQKDVLQDILEELKEIRKQTNTSVYTGTIDVQRKDVQLEQPKDLPYTEWRKGDIVEFIEEGNHWLTKGKHYEVENWWTGIPVDSDGDLRILEGDHGGGACEHHSKFKWISRGESQ